MHSSASAAAIEMPAPSSPRADSGTARQAPNGRWILYERLAGAAARERAGRPTPEGAGLPPEATLEIEYVEVWVSPDVSRGCDFRMYSSGGALVAFTCSEISRPPANSDAEPTDSAAATGPRLPIPGSPRS